MARQLDLTSLENARQRLAEALHALDGAPQNTLYLDATILRFAVTYELAHKMLKRFLGMAAANPAGIGELAFPDLIRTGSEQGLLRSGWDKWTTYRKARSITSHTYDAVNAMEVLSIVPDFLQEAGFLLSELQSRSKGTA